MTDNQSSVLQTWAVTELRISPSVNGIANPVTSFCYTLESHDLFGGITTLVGSQWVGLPDRDDFTPVDQLTEEQVLKWLDPDTKLRAEIEGVHAALELLRPEQVELPLPWGN